ncbi:MAG: PaaI family thioesterase [Acidobacteriota bacterium]|nr:PaaI family thioesterase [Acidobacteriota bacterium]
MPEEISGEHFEKLRGVLRNVPFAQFLGIELIAASVGSATLRVEVREELKQNYGVLHGGAMASLIDTATAFAIVSQLTSPEKFTTVDLSINYLRPLTQGSATCIARVVRAGRRLLTVSAEVHDDAGNLTAIALSTYIKLIS